MLKKRWFFLTSFFVCLSMFCAVTLAIAEETVVTDTQQGSVATNLGLYGGDTWDIAVDNDYIYTIASGTPNGFFYSWDAGATWQQPTGLYDYGSGQAVEVDHATGTVYVALGGDLYVSTDHGATLTLLEPSAGNPLVVGTGAIIGGWNNTVRVSTDSGTTWTSATVNTDSLWSLAASKTAGTFYATTYNSTTQTGVLNISTDYGATWTPMITSATTFTTVRTDPYNENYLTLGNDHHLWLSTDQGLTFNEITNAPASCNTISTWISTGRMYACSSFTDDNGATWTQMNFTDIVRGPGKAIEINSANEQIIYGDSMSGITKSIDGGLTWQNSYSGITGVNAQAISLTTDKITAWVSSNQGLAKSTDFNADNPTWDFPILPCAPERCDPSGIGATVWVKPDDSTIVLAGSIGGYIFRSADSGTTWVLASVPSINEAKFINTDTGMNNLTPYQFANDPNNSATVYAALSSTTIGTLLMSTDSGATWTELLDDFPAHSVAIGKNGVIYVGGGNSTTVALGMYKYADSVWTKLTGLPEDVDINSIIIDPDNEDIIYVAASGESTLGEDGFYKSTDAGVTWTKNASLADYYGFNSITLQRSTTPNILYLTCRDSESHGLLLKSSDRGDTWGILYTGLKSETYNTIVFDGLLAGSQHGLFSLKSKAKFKSLKDIKISKGEIATLSAKLQDKATKKILKNKQVLLYQKHGNHWKLKKHKKSSITGKVTFHVQPVKTQTYRLSWKPGEKYSEEYTRSYSKNVTVSIKKN